MGQIVDRPKSPPYRITMVDGGWQVVRPRASLPHAFSELDAALSFVRSDSGGAETNVEILSGSLYMLKRIAPAR
ncbi:MAG: hypothetical protein NTV97_24725 [Alphaproteobacteria bacterium]|nr:hypothetical protein [Alphaproteobacteria bacterium]